MVEQLTNTSRREVLWEECDVNHGVDDVLQPCLSNLSEMVCIIFPMEKSPQKASADSTIPMNVGIGDGIDFLIFLLAHLIVVALEVFKLVSTNP